MEVYRTEQIGCLFFRLVYCDGESIIFGSKDLWENFERGSQNEGRDFARYRENGKLDFGVTNVLRFGLPVG